MAKALAAWLLVAAVTAGSAATPSETVQSAVSRAVTIVQDAELARPVNADKRRAELRRVAEELFDFNELGGPLDPGTRRVHPVVHRSPRAIVPREDGELGGGEGRLFR